MNTYSVPLNIRYTRFDAVSQYQVDTVRYYYVQDNVMVSVSLIIKSEVIPDIISATSDNVVVGADGYLNLTLKNIGLLDSARTTIKIIRSGNSPVIPVDSSVYVGDFPTGSTVSCQYKISVAKAAQSRSYPVDVVVV